MSAEDAASIFVPWRLLENLEKRTRGSPGSSSGALNGTTQAEGPPRVVKLRMAAVFIADISGFSRLENVFEGATNLGVDTFSSLLNSVLGGIEAVVWSLGGCVVHVAGDALICVFAGDSDEANDDDDDAEHAIMEAAEEAARRTIGAFESVFKKMESRLDIHGAVSWGSLDVIRLASTQARRDQNNDDMDGSVEDGEVHDSAKSEEPPDSPQSPHNRSARGQFATAETHQMTVCGEALSLCVDLLKRTKAGEISLYRGPLLPQEIIKAGDAGGGFVTEEELKRWADHSRRGKQVAVNRDGWRSYVPEFFRARAPTVNGRFNVSEVLTSSKMHLCTLFVNFINFPIDGVGLDPELLNWAYAASCRETRDLGGHVDCLLCDDKGFVFKAYFGLAGSSVHESELRGVICSLKLSAAFKKKGVSAKMGLASGESFVGAMVGGSGKYVGFTMLSSSGVTLGARLMAKADPGAALVSSSVYKQTQGAILYKFENAAGTRTLRMKGISKPHFVFKPVAHTSNVDPDDMAQHGAGMAQIRKETLNRLDDMIERLAGGGGSPGNSTLNESSSGALGGVFVISGDAGMGKSTMLSYAKSVAEKQDGVYVVSVKGSSVNVDGPMHGARTVLSMMLKHFGGAAAAAHAIDATPEDATAIALWAPSSRATIVDWICNKYGVAEGVKEAKQRETFALVPLPVHRRTYLLQSLVVRLVAAAGPVALFVDDAQWMDENLWRVLAAVIENEKCRETFLCVLARRLDRAGRTDKAGQTDKGKVFEAFEAAAERTQKALGGWRDYYHSALLQNLSKEESRALVRWHAEGPLEESAIRQIILISEGHPFFLGELTHAASYLPGEGHKGEEYADGGENDSTEESTHGGGGVNSVTTVESLEGTLASNVDARTMLETEENTEFATLMRNSSSTKAIRRIMQSQIGDLTPKQLEVMMFATCIGMSFTADEVAGTIYNSTKERSRFGTVSSFATNVTYPEVLSAVNDAMATFVEARLLAFQRRGEENFEDNALSMPKVESEGTLSADDVDVCLPSKNGIADSQSINPTRYNFKFKHQLMRESVYGLMPKSRRVMMHSTIAQQIENAVMRMKSLVRCKCCEGVQVWRISTARRQSLATRLAGQHRLSDRPDKAWRQYFNASEAAITTGAYRDAITLMGSAIESAELAFEMNHTFKDFKRPQHFDIALLHSRMAFIFTEVTFNYDLAIHSAVKGLRWFKVPIPKKVTRGMIAKEMMLLHTGMSSMCSDYARLSSSPQAAAGAIVRCWSCLAWAVSGTMINALSSEALRDCLGWDEENAKAYLHLHTANLAMVVPDSPEFVFAMSSVSVVGFLGFKRTASLAMKKAAKALKTWKKESNKEHGERGTISEMMRASSQTLFFMTKGCLMVSDGKVPEGIRWLSEALGLATANGLAVFEMLITNFSVGINTFVRSEPRQAQASIEQLRLQGTAAFGHTSFAGRLFSILYNGAFDWNLVTLQVEEHSEKEKFPVSRMLQMTAASSDISALLTGAKPKSHGEGHCPPEEPGEKPRHQCFLEDVIPQFLQSVQSYKVNDFMPWSLTYATTSNVALAILMLLVMRWDGETPDDCGFDKIVPAAKLMEKVLVKGAKIQRVNELSFHVLLVQLSEAMDPEGFAAPGGIGRARLAALQRALKRARPDNSAAYEIWSHIGNFHADRLRGALTASSALTYQERFEAIQNEPDMPSRLRSLSSLTLAYLPTQVSRLERYIKLRASGSVGAGGICGLC